MKKVCSSMIKQSTRYACELAVGAGLSLVNNLKYFDFYIVFPQFLNFFNKK